MSVTKSMKRLLEAAKTSTDVMRDYTFQDNSGTYYTMRKEGGKYVVVSDAPYGHQNPDRALLFTYAIRKAKSFDDAVDLLRKEKYRPWSMEVYKDEIKILAKLKKQKPAAKPEPKAASKRDQGVECVRCGREMFNDRDYEETDDGPMCSTCGSMEGRWA